MRRTAAVRLVQIIAGGSLGDAAQFLGINPTGKQYVSAEHVHRWAREHAHPRQFDAALHALVEELDACSVPKLDVSLGDLPICPVRGSCDAHRPCCFD